MTDDAFNDSVEPTFLSELWHRPLTPITPSLVPLEGGGHLLYRGMTHTLAAPSGLGKTLVVLAAMLQSLRQTSQPVLLLDYEASVEVAITRLRQLGANVQDAGGIAYWRLDGPIHDTAAERLSSWVDRHDPCVIVLDGVTKATSYHDVNADLDNSGYTRWHAHIGAQCRVNGRSSDPALLLVDHVSDKTGGPNHARGATAKRDCVTGWLCLLRGPQINKERPVTLDAVIAKDRHAGGRAGKMAHIQATPVGTPDGALAIRFISPDPDRPPAPDPRVQRRYDQILQHLTDHGPSSQRAICTALGGDDRATREAIRHLASHGCITEDQTAPKSGGRYPYRYEHRYTP